MKPLAALLWLLLLANLPSAAQVKAFLTLADTTSTEKIALPFAAIRVMDARFDQETIGCIAKNLSFKGITENKSLLRFPEAASLYLPKALNRQLSFSQAASDTLLVLLKQFWVADHVYSTFDKGIRAESVLTIECSFYKTANSQAEKISSLNDIIAEEWPISGNEEAKELEAVRNEAVAKLLRQVFQNRLWTAAGPAFSVADIEAGIRKRLSSVAWAEPTFTPGLYKSFEEFKNNAPSVLNVRVGKQSKGEVKEVLDEAGNVIDPADVWGFCDGKDRYVCFQSGFHKLTAANNSLCFLFYRRQLNGGANQFSRLDYPMNTPRSVVLPLQLSDAFNTATRPEYLYLNLETGAVHVEEVIGKAPLRKLRSKSK